MTWKLLLRAYNWLIYGVTETLFVKSRLTFYDNSMDRIILRLTKC